MSQPDLLAEALKLHSRICQLYYQEEATTNLDRLHTVVEISRRVPPWAMARGWGRTFAACHNLAGIIETCEPISLIVWPLYRHNWLDHIRPMVSDVLAEHGIKFTWLHRDEMFCEPHIRVRFVSFQDRWRWHGLLSRNTYIVDDLGELNAMCRSVGDKDDYHRFCELLRYYGVDV
jgi:hypothetical protein